MNVVVMSWRERNQIHAKYQLQTWLQWKGFNLEGRFRVVELGDRSLLFRQ
jgi:hypothetical protein